jgi:hypothetical protein
MSLHRPHFFRPKKWISFVSVLRANGEFQVNPKKEKPRRGWRGFSFDWKNRETIYKSKSIS